MYHPAHIDGCTLVVLRRKSRWFGSSYEVVEAGWLSFDGNELSLRSAENSQSRVFTDAERERFLDVTAANRIKECAGYQFFMVQAEE